MQGAVCTALFINTESIKRRNLLDPCPVKNRASLIRVYLTSATATQLVIITLASFARFVGRHYPVFAGENGGSDARQTRFCNREDNIDFDSLNIARALNTHRRVVFLVRGEIESRPLHFVLTMYLFIY